MKKLTKDNIEDHEYIVQMALEEAHTKTNFWISLFYVVAIAITICVVAVLNAVIRD